MMVRSQARSVNKKNITEVRKEEKRKDDTPTYILDIFWSAGKDKVASKTAISVLVTEETRGVTLY
jgi:hypothetical protein